MYVMKGTYHGTHTEVRGQIYGLVFIVRWVLVV